MLTTKQYVEYAEKHPYFTVTFEAHKQLAGDSPYKLEFKNGKDACTFWIDKTDTEVMEWGAPFHLVRGAVKPGSPAVHKLWLMEKKTLWKLLKS
jgi:hypothetical protein